MNRNPRALCGPTRVGDPVRPFVPILIQVPDLSRSARVRRQYTGRSAVRRRRRLRKEVRIACSALLAAIPLAFAIVYFHGDKPESAEVTARLMGIEGISTSFAAAEEAARIVLPVEAVLPAPPRRVRTSVVFPGYVLPENGSQETAHAGG